MIKKILDIVINILIIIGIILILADIISDIYKNIKITNNLEYPQNCIEINNEYYCKKNVESKKRNDFLKA